MSDIFTAIGMWLLHTAVGGGLLLLITCLAMRWTIQPARRQRLGECGLIAGLLVALGSAVGPSWLVIAWSDGIRSTGLDRPLLTENVLNAQTDDSDTTLVPDSAMSLPVGAMPRFALDPRHVLDVDHDASLQRDSKHWMSQVFMGVLLAMTLAAGYFGLRLLIGYVRLYRLMRRAESAPAEIRSLFDTMSCGARWLRLLVSARILAPLSCGLWRPTVVLPSTMCQAPASRQLRWTFIHELTHLRRRDAWSTLLLNIGQVFFFALPWYWWLRRQVRLCQEYIADAAAAANNEGVEYAEFLLSLASAPAVPVGASAISGKSSDLYRRVTMLLNDSVRIENRCPRRWTMLATIVLMALAVMVSGVAYRAEAAPDEQIVIVVRPQSGQTGTQPMVQIIVSSPDGKQFEMKDDLIKGHDVLQYVPVELKFVDTIHGWSTQLDKGQRVWPVDPGLHFVEPLFIIDQTNAKGGTGWLVKSGDDLTPLHKALKRLDDLKAQGQLTKEAIHAEVTKALQEMNVPKMNFVSIEIVVSGQSDSRDKTQVVWGLDKVQIDPKAIIWEPVKINWEPVKINWEPVKIVWEPAKIVWPNTKTIPLAAKRRLRLSTEPLPGMTLEAIRPAYAEQLQLPMDVGLLVKSVSNGSSGEKAGIKADDILVKIAGGMVPGNLNEFYKFVGNLKTGVPLEVVVLRKGKMETAGNITLSESTIKWLPRGTDTKNRQGLPLLRIDDSMTIDKGKLEVSPLPTSDLIPAKSKVDGAPGQ